MNTAIEFIEAIRADPDDDFVRLRYAEWLEDKGDPLGEFIRVQIHLAEMSASNPYQEELTERQNALLEKYRFHWSVGVHGSVSFDRGLVDIAEVHPQLFVREADELFRTHPALRAVRFGPCDSKAHEYMDFWNENKDYYGDVLSAPQIGRLKALSLRDNNVGNGAPIALAGNPAAAGLRWLDLSKNQITGAGAEALAASPYFDDLRELNLAYNPIDPPERELLRARFGDRVTVRWGAHWTRFARME